jgi:2-methylisocitrate lyase-like PEP mutase family enzyme
MAERATTRFKRLLQDSELLIMPGGFSPLHARMAQRLGYDAFFMSGSQVAAYVYGYPDVGLLGLREMVEAARRLADVTDLAIFADADTGYGNALNVHHTVQEYVRAGVAGLHIEDQEAPKKSGTKAGRRCIPLDEAVGKYRAAVAAAHAIDPDFVVVARCDLIGAEGGSFDAAVERCIAYIEQGGVDAVWLNTVQTREEIRASCERIPGPVIPLYGGPAPAPTLEEYRGLGAAAVLFPALTTGVGFQATWEHLNEFRRRGPVVQREAAERARIHPLGAVGFADFVSPTADEVLELEHSFLPHEQQRDYEGTFGHRARPD